MNDKVVRLTDEEMEMIRRIQKGQVADPKFDPYEVIVIPFSWIKHRQYFLHFLYFEGVSYFI